MHPLITIKRRSGQLALLILINSFLACDSEVPSNSYSTQDRRSDSLAIDSMIRLREDAMIHRNLELVMAQFSEASTWINSQGYFFEGKQHVRGFHRMLTGNDSLDYFYEAGNPRIRIIDKENALAYYGWKMFWFQKKTPTDTTFREIGLMTLTAHKTNNQWQWVAVTNQHTPWFYKDITAVVAD